MNEDTTGTSGRRPLDWLHVTLMTVLAIIVTTMVIVWLLRVYIFPTEFEPVRLNSQEQQILDHKLKALELENTGRLKPEKYSEQDSQRALVFSEKEVNALLASNTDMARKLAIDLSDDMISAKLLILMDEDFPVLGGKTVKIKTGIEIAYRNAQPVVVLKGVSVMGVPVPNAWLGEVKNMDLVSEFGKQQGFWQSFAEGVENIQVVDGQLRVQLKE